ncbi:YjbQ family protein [Candidatus Sumerlaeota bacterium]|nr:YjbQ family protein [Candidatus Sumerlaeota bacterium]
MKHLRKELRFHTESESEVVNITRSVEAAVFESGVADGFALVYPMHTSSTVYVSDSDSSLTEDLADLLSDLVPESRPYRHNVTDSKENASAHLKAVLTGHAVTLPITNGRLDLGTYQTVYYFELDGRREKEVIVKILGE